MDLGLCGRISLPLCTQRTWCCVRRDLRHFALFRHGEYDWRFTGWMPGHEYLLATLPCDGASLGGAMRLSQHFHHAFSQGNLCGVGQHPQTGMREADPCAAGDGAGYALRLGEKCTGGAHRQHRNHDGTYHPGIYIKPVGACCPAGVSLCTGLAHGSGCADNSAHWVWLLRPDDPWLCRKLSEHRG